MSVGSVSVLMIVFFRAPHQGPDEGGIDAAVERRHGTNLANGTVAGHDTLFQLRRGGQRERQKMGHEAHVISGSKPLETEHRVEPLCSDTGEYAEVRGFVVS